MNTLRKRPDAAITNMGSVVVVTEENSPADVILRAEDRIV
jgi:hypothetical protein